MDTLRRGRESERRWSSLDLILVFMMVLSLLLLLLTFGGGLTDNSGGLSMTCGLPLFSSFLISQLHKIKMTEMKERLKQFSILTTNHNLSQITIVPVTCSINIVTSSLVYNY